VHAFSHVAGWYYAAPYGVYATSDGHLAVSLTPIAALAEVLPEPRLHGYSEEDSWTKQEEIGSLIAARLASKTTRAWTSLMEPLAIWHAPVRGYEEILADPQVAHMKALITAPGGGENRAPVTFVNHPVLYDGEAADVRLPPQPLGAQSAEVLREIGYSDAEIAALLHEQVVAGRPA
jgi:crotonobetainyl-CoA:carnitine CoA-transferase CaiB-like acyl-CoA transferase